MIRKYYKMGFLALLTLINVTAGAQDDEAAVKATVNQLFEGMKKRDTSMIRASFAPAAYLQTVVKAKDGSVLIRSEILDSFLASVAKPRPELLDERIRFETVKVDGDLAIAWTPYQFYFGENFSHCGVNSFQLVRLNGNWKIQYLIDTRRKQNCQ